MRAFFLAVVVAVVALGGACGDDDDGSTARKAFGASERDVGTLQDIFSSMKGFPYENARLARALQSEDLDAADRSLTKLDRVLDDAEADATGLESDEARSAVDDYLAALRELVGTYDRLLVVALDPSATSEAVNDVLADLQEAGQDAMAADQAFARRVLDALPEDQRAELRERLRELTQQLQEEATP
jgi:hypothetical protein